VNPDIDLSALVHWNLLLS